MPNQHVEIIEENETYRIEKHQIGGFRFIFENYNAGLSTKESAVMALETLNVEHEVFANNSVCTVVRILSGEFRGDYDTEFDFDSGAFRLFQDC